MMTTARHRAYKLTLTSCGFTLVELLTVSFLLGLFVASVASVSTSMLNSDLRLLQIIALRDNWKKISQLMNADVQEACSASVSNNILTLRILPQAVNPTITCSSIDASGNPYASTITYRLSGTNLLRNGPRVKQDGTLSSGNTFLGSSEQILSSDVSYFLPSIAAGSSFNPAFKLTLTRGGVSYSGSDTQTVSSESRTRVRAFD